MFSKYVNNFNNRRAILHQVIEIIKTLGKQGLAFRGKRNESSEKGRQYEEKRALQQKQGKVGRGSFNTFLSKSTVTSLVRVMRNLIQERIANDVRAAGIYSIEIDSTQDISSQDQCSIVIRYARKGEVHERLLRVMKGNSSGKALLNLLKSTLDRLQLDISNCVGDSFDGAANMSGEYKGVQARISEVASNHIHVWCYAHTLNLVLGDVTSLNVIYQSFWPIKQSCNLLSRISQTYECMGKHCSIKDWNFKYEETKYDWSNKIVGKVKRHSDDFWFF